VGEVGEVAKPVAPKHFPCAGVFALEVATSGA